MAIAAAALLGFASCSDNWEPGGNQENGMGQAKFGGIDVVNSENIVSRASVDVSNFIVTVVNGEGATVKEWKYSEMPEIITLDVANDYVVNVISHQQEKAAWDAPYFEGSSEKFSIKNNEITEIGKISCKLANIKVSIRFSEGMKAAMGSDCKVTVVANDEGRLEFNANETRSGYFQALEGSMTLVATFTGTVNGNYEEIVRSFKDVEAGQHRIITYSLKSGDPTIPDEYGNIDPESGISVDMDTIDETIEGNVPPGDEDVIDGDRPGKEDPEDPNEPEDPNNPDNPENPDDPSEDLFTIDGGIIDLNGENIPVEGEKYVVTIDSKNPLSNLVVEIISESLNDDMLSSVGLSATFDLAYPGALEDALRDSFHFPVGNEVIGQNHVVFDITDFVPLLNIYKGEIHKFKLTIKDQSGNEKVVTLTFRTLAD